MRHPRFGIFCYHREPGFLWFRIFGVGLLIKDTKRHAMIFSERYGYARFIRVGRWIIRPLGRKS